jgi:nicotinamide-nucleotide adenylyltransferase
MQKIPIAVVHGRYQPPHNGHLRYMLMAFEKAEHILIGVCTPEICSDEEAERTGYPCSPHLNPFSYEDRKAMISLALTEQNILPSRYTIIPFPSDYKNIETLIPHNAVFFMSVTSEHDSKKIEHLKQKGFVVETIFSQPNETPREHGEQVRDSVRAGTADWQDIVPEAVQQYIRKNNLL